MRGQDDHPEVVITRSDGGTATSSPIMSDSYARLEPFLLMARSTKGAAAAKIVLDAIAAVS
jgi:hypothetical protein